MRRTALQSVRISPRVASDLLALFQSLLSRFNDSRSRSNGVRNLWNVCLLTCKSTHNLQPTSKVPDQSAPKAKTRSRATRAERPATRSGRALRSPASNWKNCAKSFRPTRKCLIRSKPDLLCPATCLDSSPIIGLTFGQITWAPNWPSSWRL